jgi:DNA-binding CsgD family transcriptional regulator
MGSKGPQFIIPPNYRNDVTARQAELLDLQMQGLSYWDIADKLCISPSSVSITLMRARKNIAATKKSPRKPEELTPREQEILTLKSLGLTNIQIAMKLRISKHTVKSHVYHAKAKMNETNAN